MFQALNQLLFLFPLVKTFVTVNAHMAVSFFYLLLRSGANRAVLAHMTFHWHFTDPAFVAFSLSLFWDLFYEQGEDDIVRIETGTEPTSLFAINPPFGLGFVHQVEVRCFLTLTRTRLTFILTDEGTAPLLPLFNFFTFGI